ncbi:hypothetical protein ACFXMT_33675 [Streptomyces mirabilis]|uniref:hypothetical protein n=1 Tax=Streptomyces mirabilis TaxID=68239 RepID=UPI0036828701
MNSDDPTNHAPLRDVAQNSAATARYLAGIQRVLLDIGASLEVLERETRVHLRDTHVEGDRFYHARLRARPVERALNSLLRDIKDLTSGMEKAAYKRKSFDDGVKNLPQKRREKQLEKERKRNPQPLQAAQEKPQQDVQGQDPGYSGPTSIYNLGKRESA